MQKIKTNYLICFINHVKKINILKIKNIKIN